MGSGCREVNIEADRAKQRDRFDPIAPQKGCVSLIRYGKDIILQSESKSRTPIRDMPGGTAISSEW